MKKDETQLKIIRYTFSPDEIVTHSKELAEVCGQKKEIEEEKKAIVSQFKAKVDAHDARISLLSKWVTAGYDYRNLECVVKKNFKSGKKEFYYQGELVDEEPLTAADHQLAIAE